MATRKLYECPVFEARMFERQCRANRQRARGEPVDAAPSEGREYGEGRVRLNLDTEAADRVAYAACLVCPGVRALVRQGKTNPPEAIEVAPQRRKKPSQTKKRRRALDELRGDSSATSFMERTRALLREGD